MKRSTDHILTSHIGSLVRPPALRELLAARERGDVVDDDQFETLAREAVAVIVRKQAEIGVDVINDGEQSKFSYSNYAKHRVGGLEMVDAEAPAGPSLGGEARDFPDYFARRVYGGRVDAPVLACTGTLAYAGHDALKRDLEHLLSACADVDIAEPFMSAISPGMFKSIPNRHYASEEEYDTAIADVLKEEYEAIVAAGVLLQIDCPDLGIYTRTHLDADLDEYRRAVAYNVELLNYATRDIAPEAMRFHVCWGADEAPHHRDVPLEQVVDLLLAARPAGMTIVAANGRHEHEWKVWAGVTLPEGKVLMPGVIDSTSNIIEHPELVAERIVRYAQVLGRENVIAGVDCGFSTFATDQSDRVDPAIAWAKLQSLVDGAALATRELWP